MYEFLYINWHYFFSEADKLIEDYKLNLQEKSKKQNFQRKIENIVDETLDLFDVMLN